MVKQDAQSPMSNDSDLAKLDDEARALAQKRHALNVLIREFDWLRSQEAVVYDGLESVSEVVRVAIRDYLDRHEHADDLRRFATQALDFELAQEQRRNASRTGVP